MSKKIITISREFGSGGRYLGKKIAEKLGWDYYDKEIIAKVAEKTGLSQKYIEQAGEYAPSKNIFAYAFVGRNHNGVSLGDYMYAAQREIILEAAEKSACVMVGRCADYILKDREDCLNVFICGNAKEKLKRIMDLYKVSEAEAKKLIRETDKKRSVNYNYYTEQEWGKAENYTICLNSSDIGYERCIDMICGLI